MFPKVDKKTSLNEEININTKEYLDRQLEDKANYQAFKRLTEK